MKFYTAILFMVLSFTSLAAPQKVMLITNDIDTNLITISVDENDQGFKNIQKIETDVNKMVVDNKVFNALS